MADFTDVVQEALLALLTISVPDVRLLPDDTFEQKLRAATNSLKDLNARKRQEVEAIDEEKKNKEVSSQVMAEGST